jgi:MFS family permease
MRWRDYVTMNVYWFGLAFMWNALHPIILPALLLWMVPESLKNTYLGGMTFTGLILAMVIQPLAGALSDRTRSRWGRRRPWMVAGTLLGLCCLAAMALAKSFAALLLGYLLLQFVSNMAHGPAQGLIPDLVPSDRRGMASGIKNLFDMLGLVITSLVAGNLMGGGNPVLAFAIIGAVLAISALTTILTTPEGPTSDAETSAVDHRLPDLLRVDWQSYPEYKQMIISRYLILVGIYAVQSFAQYYIRDWLRIPNPAEVTGNLLGAIGLALTALVFPAGWLSDRLGRLRLNVMAGALAAVGIFLLIFSRSVTSVYVFGGIIGAATGMFVSVNWALATDLIPQEEAGKYLGLSNLATAGAGATSRLGGPLIDAFNALRPGAYLGYPVLFLLASASTLLGTLLIRRIQRLRQTG